MDLEVGSSKKLGRAHPRDVAKLWFVLFMSCLNPISSKLCIHELYSFLGRTCISWGLYHPYLEATRLTLTLAFLSTYIEIETSV